MNNEMAYLLGMITGNCEIQRNSTETIFTINIPHKKLETEFNNDVGVYVRASITDIRNILDPLLGTQITFTPNRNISYISFRKPNEDYCVRELMRYIGNATSSENMRISPEVYGFTTDERRNFVKGFADVTGYIRRSNYFISEPNYRVYFEIPQNWYLVIDFANLLKSLDVPVQTIDWAHPNMRDAYLKKYNKGNVNFWKKEHQLKVWAVEYQHIGFAVIHKQQALDYFADLHRKHIINNQHKSVEEITHRYYWDIKSTKKKSKPSHPGENDGFLPSAIRGRHFNRWTEIADALGYNKES
ncbi:hypothetical protein [Anaerovibrio lipolyticus]|uniref:hypothetical protein n=1 Tax=Anaerovibrio lipolyticus TaxID=82374 RepID=UPI0023F1C00F|nr:hypothetical protein [Anaerovibrio lipolyticus]